MKLNPDCAREVLLALENVLQIDENLTMPALNAYALFDLIPKFSKPDVLYTLQKLEEAGFIIASFQFVSGSLSDGYISSITYRGHEFLENIRENKNWEKVKSAAAKIGSFSVSVLGEISKSLILTLISSSIT